MRLIKFRAWDSFTGKMIVSDFHPFGEVMSFGIIEAEIAKTKNPKYEEDGYYISLLRTNDVIITQYTGLNDKNGKPIYEGDIVKCMPDIEYLRQVVFEDGNYYLVNPDNKMPFPIQVVISSHPETIVVGNIYETPELLINGENTLNPLKTNPLETHSEVLKDTGDS